MSKASAAYCGGCARPATLYDQETGHYACVLCPLIGAEASKQYGQLGELAVQAFVGPWYRRTTSVINARNYMWEQLSRQGVTLAEYNDFARKFVERMRKFPVPYLTLPAFKRVNAAAMLAAVRLAMQNYKNKTMTIDEIAETMEGATRSAGRWLSANQMLMDAYGPIELGVEGLPLRITSPLVAAAELDELLENEDISDEMAQIGMMRWPFSSSSSSSAKPSLKATTKGLALALLQLLASLEAVRDASASFSDADKMAAYNTRLSLIVSTVTSIALRDLGGALGPAEIAQVQHAINFFYQRVTKLPKSSTKKSVQRASFVGAATDAALASAMSEAGKQLAILIQLAVDEAKKDAAGGVHMLAVYLATTIEKQLKRIVKVADVSARAKKVVALLIDVLVELYARDRLSPADTNELRAASYSRFDAYTDMGGGQKLLDVGDERSAAAATAAARDSALTLRFRDGTEVECEPATLYYLAHDTDTDSSPYQQPVAFEFEPDADAVQDVGALFGIGKKYSVSTLRDQLLGELAVLMRTGEISTVPDPTTKAMNEATSDALNTAADAIASEIVQQTADVVADKAVLTVMRAIGEFFDTRLTDRAMSRATPESQFTYKYAGKKAAATVVARHFTEMVLTYSGKARAARDSKTQERALAQIKRDAQDLFKQMVGELSRVEGYSGEVAYDICGTLLLDIVYLTLQRKGAETDATYVFSRWSAARQQPTFRKPNVMQRGAASLRGRGSAAASSAKQSALRRLGL